MSELEACIESTEAAIQAARESTSPGLKLDFNWPVPAGTSHDTLQEIRLHYRSKFGVSNPGFVKNRLVLHFLEH